MDENLNFKQRVLDQKSINEFNVDVFSERQATHFKTFFAKTRSNKSIKIVVDMGGGNGYFATELSKMEIPVRVIDSDNESIQNCKNLNNSYIDAHIGNALSPDIKGDEDIICFNLILHHLIGATEKETRELQKQSISLWRDRAQYIFINEYIYDSFIGYFSGRLIYEITKNKILSMICKFFASIIPSFRANTFGVGVRFRAHQEWCDIFEECEFEIVSKIYAQPDYTSPFLRALFIREVRTDSFLLKAKRV
jgi:hypothetical protein